MYCRHKRQEVQLLSERQEIFKRTMEDKLSLHSRATERYHDQIFEEAGRKEARRSSAHGAQKVRIMKISERER